MDVKAIIENYRKVVTEKYFCFEGRTGRKSGSSCWSTL